MPIRFRCEGCDSKIKVPDGTEGRKVKCPRCHLKQLVPFEQVGGREEATERPSDQGAEKDTSAAKASPAFSRDAQRSAGAAKSDAPAKKTPPPAVDDTANPLDSLATAGDHDADDPLAALANAADTVTDDGGIDDDLFNDEPSDDSQSHNIDDTPDTPDSPDSADELPPATEPIELIDNPASPVSSARPTPQPTPVEQRSATTAPASRKPAPQPVHEELSLDDDGEDDASEQPSDRSSSGTRGPRAIPLSGASLSGSQPAARPAPRPAPTATAGKSSAPAATAAAAVAAATRTDIPAAAPSASPAQMTTRSSFKAPAYSSLMMISWILRVLAFLFVGVTARDTMEALNSAGDITVVSKAILGTIVAARGLAFAILIWAAAELALAVRDIARNSYR